MNTGHDVQRAATLTGAATGAQTHVSFALGARSAAVQLETSGTGTIRVQGRFSPDAPWSDLTADIALAAPGSSVTLISVAAPQMRINVTANSANLNAWLMA